MSVKKGSFICLNNRRSSGSSRIVRFGFNLIAMRAGRTLKTLSHFTCAAPQDRTSCDRRPHSQINGNPYGNHREGRHQTHNRNP